MMFCRAVTRRSERGGGVNYGWRIRIFTSVTTTSARWKAEISCSAKAWRTKRMRFSRESSATRRIMMPAWVPGGYLRVSEKSRSCVMRKRSSSEQACQILSSGSPTRFSSKTLWTSCPRAPRPLCRASGRFSSSLILTQQLFARLEDPRAQKPLHRQRWPAAPRSRPRESRA